MTFAIMSVTPYEVRLSEETIAKGIISFYTSCHLIPAGISMVALEKWAAKMAHGARKVVSKFRRVYAQTPTKAKNEVLCALKLRCQKAGLSPGQGAEEAGESTETQSSKSEATDSRPCTHEDLEEVAPPDTSSVSWVERLKQKLLEKKQSEVKKLARPVATPARADGHQVPPFVLENMAKNMPEVKPFATTTTEDDEDKADGSDQKKRQPKTVPRSPQRPRLRLRLRGKRKRKSQGQRLRML